MPIKSPISHFRGKPTNGDYRREARERSRSPIERLHAAHLYPHMPNLAMEQPLALTKSSAKIPSSPSASPIERQQVNHTVYRIYYCYLLSANILCSDLPHILLKYLLLAVFFFFCISTLRLQKYK